MRFKTKLPLEMFFMLNKREHYVSMLCSLISISDSWYAVVYRRHFGFIRYFARAAYE